MDQQGRTFQTNGIIVRVDTLSSQKSGKGRQSLLQEQDLEILWLLLLPISKTKYKHRTILWGQYALQAFYKANFLTERPGSAN